jgi:hypothetical protein
MILKLVNLVGWALVILSLALFSLSIDEEGRIESRIEKWWGDIRLRKSAALSYSAAFMQKVLTLTGKGFDAIFGMRLFSVRTATVSLCFSVASLPLFGMVIGPWSRLHPGVTIPQGYYSSLASWFLLFLLIGLIPAMFPQVALVRVWEGVILGSLIILVIAGSRLAYVYKGREWSQNVVVASLAVIIFSLLSDVLYIACTRWLLGVAAQCHHFAAIFLIICTDVVLAIVLMLLPVRVGVGIAWLFPVAGAAVVISFVLNFVDVVACLAVVAFAALMLFHRFTWPVLERILAPVLRYKLVGIRKPMLKLGLGMIGITQAVGALAVLVRVFEKLA